MMYTAEIWLSYQPSLVAISTKFGIISTKFACVLLSTLVILYYEQFSCVPQDTLFLVAQYIQQIIASTLSK